MANADAGKVYQNNHTATVGGTSITKIVQSGSSTINLPKFILAKDIDVTNNGQAKRANKVLTSTANFYGISGTNVEIEMTVTNFTDKLTKTMPNMIMIPKRNKPDQFIDTSFIDLRRITDDFTIQGSLCDSTGNMTGTATTATAVNQKNCLKAMAEEGGAVRLYYRTEAVMCTIKDINFTDTYTEPSTNDPLDHEVIKLDFSMTLSLGWER